MQRGPGGECTFTARLGDSNYLPPVSGALSRGLIAVHGTQSRNGAHGKSGDSENQKKAENP